MGKREGRIPPAVFLCNALVNCWMQFLPYRFYMPVELFPHQTRIRMSILLGQYLQNASVTRCGRRNATQRREAGKTYPPSEPRQTVKVARFDIVRRVKERRLLWLEEAEDLESAKSRIQELASVWPGEFEVMDRCSHRVVAKSALTENRGREYVSCNSGKVKNA